MQTFRKASTVDLRLRSRAAALTLVITVDINIIFHGHARFSDTQ